MAYTDELFRVVDEYFMEIIMPYGRTNAEAGEYLKKFKPFGTCRRSRLFHFARLLKKSTRFLRREIGIDARK